MFLKRELALVAVTQAGTYIPAAGKEWLFTIKFNIKLSMQKNRDSAKKSGMGTGISQLTQKSQSHDMN